MTFKIPQIGCKSLTEGYLEGFPKFNWSDLQDKDEIRKGSFGSVCKARFVPDSRMVVVKRFFGAGDVILKNVAKEAKMLQTACHPKIAEFLGVCRGGSSLPIFTVSQPTNLTMSPEVGSHPNTNSNTNRQNSCFACPKI